MKNDTAMCAKHERPLICPSCEAEKAARKTMTAKQRTVRARKAAKARWEKLK